MKTRRSPVQRTTFMPTGQSGQGSVHDEMIYDPMNSFIHPLTVTSLINPPSLRLFPLWQDLLRGQKQLPAGL